MRRLQFGWESAAGVAALLLLLALGVIRAQQGAAPEISTPSTFDFGRSGYAALYQLLRTEGVHVGRFERSHLQLQGISSALLIAQVPYGALAGGGLTRNDVIALKDWVMHGGRLIVLSPPYGDAGDTLLGIPATQVRADAATHATAFAKLPVTSGIQTVEGNFANEFGIAGAPKALPLLVSDRGIVALQYRLGRGTVTAVTDPSIFSNARLGNADNARFAFNLLAPTGVEFDESIHGYGSKNSLWAALPLPVHYAVYVAAFALLLALIGNLIRFAPPLELTEADDRDSAAYVNAMASLLERAGASRRVLHDRADFTLRGIRRSLGLSDRTQMPALLARVEQPKIRSEIVELSRLDQIDRPNAAHLMRAGVLCVNLEKEFGA